MHELFNWLEQQVGADWIDDSTEPNHPLKYALRAYRSPHLSSEMRLSQDLPRALAFAKTALALSKFPIRLTNGLVIEDRSFRDQLIFRAKQSVGEFSATEMEATVAVAYACILQHPIVALEAGQEPTPDFEITVEGQPIYIECKARNIVTPTHRKIDSIRSEINAQIGLLLKHSIVNYGVAISVNNIPEREAIPDLVNAVSRLLLSGKAFAQSVGIFRVEATILLPKDKEIVTPTLEPLGPVRHVPDPVRSFIIRNGIGNPTTYANVFHECQIRKVDNLIYYQNPKVLVVHVAVTPDHTKAIANLISNGRAQLPSTTSGIIAIRAPDFYGPRQFVKLGQSISKALNSTRRVSAVILWHQAIKTEIRNPNEVNHKLWWQLVCLRNGRARYPLPISFESNHLPRGEGFELFH